MDDIIKSCLENDYNSVENFLKLNKTIKISGDVADIMVSNAICNNDLEMLDVLFSNKIKFTDKMLDYLPTCGEDIFFILVNYIQKGNVDFVVEDSFDILFEMAMSRSTTYRMFEYILSKTQVSPHLLNFKGSKYYHVIAESGNTGILPYLIKTHQVNIFEKDDLGYTVFDYAIKSKNILLFDEITKIY